MTLTVIKKDGTKESWNDEKILIAINKAADRVNYQLTSEEKENILNDIYEYFSNEYLSFSKNEVHTNEIHSAVIFALNDWTPTVGKAYQNYRDYKTSFANKFEQLRKETDDVIFLGDKENANFDSSLISTKGSLVKGYLTKSLYQQFYLSTEEKELTKRGDIYIHDLRDAIFNSVNCCLFDIATVLKGGFEMSNIHYTEPKSVLTALQVIGDITLVATAQQFGGFTLAEIDKVLLPYAQKTFKDAFVRYFNICHMEYDEAFSMAWSDLRRELEQGFQSLELKLNTVPCSRGDFAFTTLTFGTWDIMMDDLDREIMKLIGEVILETRMKGHGGKQVVFPKLVFLYDEHKIEEDKDHQALFEKAVECSSKCMYPDFLSLTSDYGTVSQLYKDTGVITSPMGCRAYLTPWMDPETGKFITIGRCNIGAVSLNLPLIYKYAQVNKVSFFSVLAQRLQTIRKFFKKRYELIAHTKASTNPLAFTQGGFYKGTKKLDEEIGDLTQYMTASFGITALNELTILATGKSIYEDESYFAKIVVKFIKDMVISFKEEDGFLYALYGTPAESLCGTQAHQYNLYCASCGVENVLNTEYFTNSFHMHVSEDITPIEKQQSEFELFHLIEGGHIQYIRMDNPKNIKALTSIIKRGMQLGFYQGINFDSATCEHCGSHFANLASPKCPKCGSTELTIISRTCGYLGYSRLRGESRMNDAKMAEIRDRKSM